MTTKDVPERNKKRAVADKDKDKKKRKNKFAEAFEKRYGKGAAKKAEGGAPFPPKK